MATRKHSLLAANRKNMGLIEDAYNQTQAFNDPVVQRRKMFGHIADTGKTIVGGYNKLKDAAQDYYTGELQKNPPVRPEIEGEIVSEDDDFEINKKFYSDNLVIEEVPFDPDMTEFKPPADNAEWERSQLVGKNPDRNNIVTSSQGSGPTSYGSTINTKDLVFKPTVEDISNIVNVAVNGIPTKEEIEANPINYYRGEQGLYNFGVSKYNTHTNTRYGTFMNREGKK